MRFLKAIGPLVLMVAGCTAPSAEPSGPQVSENFAVTPDSVRLYYRVVGSGDETVIAPFALFHGTALDTLAVSRRIVTYDPRGRGRSDAVPTSKVSLDHLLLDLEVVQRAVGAERAMLIGWSGSGMELFAYAHRHPERVSRFVQLAPVGPRFVPWGAQMMADQNARTDSAARAAHVAQREAGAFEGKPAEECRASAQVTTPALLHDRATLPLIPDVCGNPNEHLATIGAYFGALFPTIQNIDWRDSLAAVTIPRLVVHPERDNIPLASSNEWVKGQPNARLIVIPASGHFPHYENRAATINALFAFLAGGWPEGARAIP